MLKINRVSIGSAFRVGAVMMGLIWVLFGLLFIFFPDAMVGSSITYNNGQLSQAYEGPSPIFIYLCGLPIYAIIGGIGGALYAFAYNLAAGWVGGIELDVTNIDSYNRTPYEPPKLKNDDDTSFMSGDRQL